MDIEPTSAAGKIVHAVVQANGKLCLRCLLLAAGVGEIELAEPMESIGARVHAHVQPHLCVRCGENGMTYDLDDGPPKGSSSLRPNHRGRASPHRGGEARVASPAHQNMGTLPGVRQNLDGGRAV